MQINYQIEASGQEMVNDYEINEIHIWMIDEVQYMPCKKQRCYRNLLNMDFIPAEPSPQTTAIRSAMG